MSDKPAGTDPIFFRSAEECVFAIDEALAEAFEPKDEANRIVDEVLEELNLCGYCGEPCDGRWCSRECRRADAYDGQHESER